MKRKPQPVAAIVRSMWGFDNTYSAWDGDQERGVKPRTTPMSRAELAAKRAYYRSHTARLASAMRASPVGRQPS